jgi:Asp/Glu/hydantoin racemase
MKGDSKGIRLRYQSYVDRKLAAPYIDRLRLHLDEIRGPATTIELIELSPPDSYAHPLVEFRCARDVVRNAIQAERDGCDAFAIGHIQDSGLWEARSAVQIPVLGLGEVCMLHACTLASRAGLVTINPAFVPGFRQQIRRYGLEHRVPFVASIDYQPGDFMRAFESAETRSAVLEQYRVEAEKIVQAGADVFIPGGGILMLLLEMNQVRSIGGAPVVPGIATLIEMAEMAVRLRRRHGVETSRLGDFKLPPPHIIDEFLGS